MVASEAAKSNIRVFCLQKVNSRCNLFYGIQRIAIGIYDVERLFVGVTRVNFVFAQHTCYFYTAV